MVNNNIISETIAEAEKKTSAEFATVVAPASDVYESYALLIGLAVGGFSAFILWQTKLVTFFPSLLITQLLIVSLTVYLPPLHNFCLRFVPKKIKHARAAHRAYEEYLTVSEQLPAHIPIVLLYISQAERYAHIIYSRKIREKLPQEIREKIIGELTASIKQTDIQTGCVAAIRHISELIAPHFPATNDTNYVSDSVIEI